MGMRRELEVYSGGNKLQTLVLRKKKTQIGGKIVKKGQEKNDITLEDEKIARRHAQVILDGNIVYIQNLHKDHSTIVNGKAIVKRELKDKDEISVGPYRVTYRVHKEVNWVPIIAVGVIVFVGLILFLTAETPSDKYVRATRLINSDPVTAMEALQDLVSKYPLNPYYKVGLAHSYYKVGELVSKTGTTWVTYLQKAEHTYLQFAQTKDFSPVLEDKAFWQKITTDLQVQMSNYQDGVNMVNQLRTDLKKIQDMQKGVF